MSKKGWGYGKVVKQLRKFDKDFMVYIEKGKGSHRQLFHPNIEGEERAYPLPYHNNKTAIPPFMLNAIIRKFQLPDDIFD